MPSRVRGWFRLLGALLVVAMCALGCDSSWGASAGKSKDKKEKSSKKSGKNKLLDRAKKLEPKAKKRLKQLSALAAKAKAEPEVTSDQPFTGELDEEERSLIGQAWLADLNRDASDKELDFEGGVWENCDFDEDDIDKDDIEFLEECIAVSYAAVIRTHKLTMPVVDTATKSFTVGEFVGDLLLIHLESGEIRGRYRLVATNSSELKPFKNDMAAKDWELSAKSDLESAVERAANGKLGDG